MQYQSAPSLKANLFYNIAYELLVIAIPLVTAPYLSRVLGAEYIGIYSYTYSIAGLFAMFSLLGMKNHGNRCIAGVRENPIKLAETFWSLFALQLIASALVLAAYACYTVFLAHNRGIALLWLPFIVSSLLDINWFFFGLERFRLTVTRNFVIKLVTFLLLFLVVKNSEDLGAYVLLTSSSLLISQIVLWPFLFREIGFAHPSKLIMLANVKPLFILFVPVLAISVYAQVDKVLLGFLSTMEQTGYFENSIKITGVSLTLVTALGTVMLPRMSNLVAQGKLEEGQRYLSKSMWFVLMLSCAMACGLVAIAPVLAPIYFGKGFEPCAVLISIIAIDMPFMAWANVIRTQYLIPMKMDRVYVVSVILGALVNVLTNLVLIPILGAIGAAVATVLAEIAVCLYQSFYVRDQLPLGVWAKENMPFLLLAVFMAIIVRAICIVMGTSVISLVMGIAVGVISYSALCAVYLRLSHNKYAEESLWPLFKSLKDRLLKG